MASLGLRGWTRLACSSALAVSVMAACGGESQTSDDDVPGSSAGDGGSAAGSSGRGGSAGKGGAKSSSGGSGGTAGAVAGTGSTVGGSSGTAGTEPGLGGADDGGASGTSGSAGTGGGGGSGGELPDIPLNQMCETFEPCGGDPEGSWTATETCLVVPGDVTFLDAPGCEDAVEGVGAVVAGTRSYEDGTLTYEQLVTVRAAIVVSDTCASGLLMQDVDAETLCPFLPTLAAAGMQTPFRSITCELMDAQCHCDAYYDAETTTTTTTYVVDGTRITEGTGSGYDFCQDGDSLILHGTGDATNNPNVDELTVEYTRDE